MLCSSASVGLCLSIWWTRQKAAIEDVLLLSYFLSGKMWAVSHVVYNRIVSHWPSYWHCLLCYCNEVNNVNTLLGSKGLNRCFFASSECQVRVRAVSTTDRLGNLQLESSSCSFSKGDRKSTIWCRTFCDGCVSVV